MTINIKLKHLIITGLIIIIGCIGFFFREKIANLFVSGGEKTVEKALNYFKSQKEEEKDVYSLFDLKFTTELLMKNSYYKVSEWKLSTKEKDGKTVVIVEGTTTNGFGAKLDRNVAFVTEKQNGTWVIVDSYDFFVFDKIKDSYALGKSDLEKQKIMDDVREKVVIEDWEFRSSYGNSIKGTGIIINNSDIPVNFIKVEITYRDKSGNVTNTDESFAIDSDDLEPGQKRSFEFYTANCYSCNKASIALKFD
ncbi:MAG: FxLYD domain-containing protein [Bacteroidia bacterium]|nr:FxLYD domain-containing protein [Bacteroidia bacterium]